jgi:hypothetical protein
MSSNLGAAFHCIDGKTFL